LKRVGVRSERAGGEVIFKEGIKQDIIFFQLLISIIQKKFYVNKIIFPSLPVKG